MRATEKYGTKINVYKTKVMVIKKESEDCAECRVGKNMI